jgi:hypothetical protein
MILLEQRDVSELAPSSPAGLVITHPLADISLGEQAQVRLDLLVEFSIGPAISEQSPKSRHDGAKIIDDLYS